MPPNDWDNLAGSKMQTGHEADIYQLEDYSTLEEEYEKFLEPLLAITDKPQEVVKPESEQIRQLQSIISSQQQTIAFLTEQLKQFSSAQPFSPP